MIEMQVVNTRPGKPRDGGTRLEAFEAGVLLTSVKTSDYILMPSDITNISVTVSFTAGAAGYVEASTDIVDKIVDGTAIYKIWAKGEVSDITQDSAYPPTAIRAVQTIAGTMYMSVRAQ